MGNVKYTLNSIYYDISNSKKKIVTTCGCFSILHPGHIEYLKCAKGLGDILVVGINSDEYIKKYKKYKFYFTEIERLTMVKELKCVDYAFIFDDYNFCSSLKIIKPSIFAKGTDYKNNINIDEFNTCKDYDIEIRYVGGEKLYNAGKIITKL